MKGVVFTEFMEMVESAHGVDMVDDLIEATSPASGGAYTSAGTYDHKELVAMVKELGERTETLVPDLLAAFGRYLIPKFHASFPAFFEHPGLFEFMASVHGYIHVEVRKLYPDAELPEVEFTDLGNGVGQVRYRSTRHLEEFGRGLIEGAAHHYRQGFSITQSRVDENTVLFEIRLTDS